MFEEARAARALRRHRYPRYGVPDHASCACACRLHEGGAGIAQKGAESLWKGAERLWKVGMSGWGWVGASDPSLALITFG
jgi:hypothetical protein